MNKQALSLAIFIAGAYPAASSALGLGDIESSSHLNQPLRAKIDLLSAAPADASQIQVRLAPPDVFNRVGVARPAFLSSLHFTPSVQGGKPVILVTSDGPIQEPFVNFLLEVSWPQGQLLKEYTVMLDPPVLMQPGNTVAGDATVRAEPKAAGNVRRPSRQASAQPAAPSGQPAASGTGRNRTYRVRSGDTLFRVASRLQQPGVSNDQMMMALFRANPNAFIGDNINNLRTGATLKAPASGDAGDISRAEARRQIRQQNAEWREFRKSLAGKTVPQQSTGAASAAKPSAPTAATRNTAAKTDDKARLEVLGAQAAGSEAKNAAVAAGNAKLAALEKQLALANESLTARQNENKDLKSRVTDLESMLSKKNRLLALRDNQLAELQQQLAANGIKTPPLAETPEAQEASAQQAAANKPQSPAPVAPTPAPDQGKDIQTHMANVAGKDNDAVLRGEQPAASAPPTPPGGVPTGIQPPAGTPPVVAANPNPPANASSNLVPLSPPVENTPPKPVNKPAVVPVTPISGPEDKKPASVFADQTTDSNDLLGMLTSPLALKIGAGSLALLLLLWLLGRRRKPDGADSAKAKDRFANLDDELDEPIIEEEPLDLGTLESELDKAEQRGSRGYGSASHGQADPFGIRDDSAWDEGGHVPVSAAHENSHESGSGEDDLLTEANVYIAYGLYQQAESELKKGIERQPDKLEYRHKLLECYFSANNREAFDNQAQQFASMNGPNKAALWKSIADWGRKISPDNKLYQGDGSGVSMVAATVTSALGGIAAAGAAAVAAADDTVPHVAEGHPLKPVEPVETHGRPIAEEHPLKPVEPVAAHGRDDFAGAPVMDDDFGDLDLGDLDFDDIDLDKLLQDGESADVEPPAPQAAMSTLPDLPDLSAGQPPNHQPNQPHPLEANSSELAGEAFELDDLDDDLDLDFDLDLPDAPSQPLLDVDAAKGGNGSASGVLDFSLDDDADKHKADTPVVGAVAAAAIAAPAVAAAAGNSTNLNLHLDNNTGITRILPKDTFYAPISEEDKDWLGDIDDALSFLDFPDEEIDLHEAHISTKLDLARAYLDMGDIEGARSTLEEVMVEGNDDQRREAEVLLHQTG